ncbi:hypothetical protein G6F62_014968 [Rhizopus arrhizus]|nr:hypothetical protein G6F62_014968 [Rhizopus arrhizus]
MAASARARPRYRRSRKPHWCIQPPAGTARHRPSACRSGRSAGFPGRAAADAQPGRPAARPWPRRARPRPCPRPVRAPRAHRSARRRGPGARALALGKALGCSWPHYRAGAARPP